MPLTHEEQELQQAVDLIVAPLYSLESTRIPRHTLPADELPPDVAWQIIHDELMLDGNARLNLATFVTTWMEPQAEQLMAECLDKNMIDKDEYPQTAALETRCVNILADLWHAPDTSEATGCSTTGSSEAAMLGGLALKRRWQQPAQGRRDARRQAEPRHGRERPGLLGEVRELLGRRDAPRADGGRPLPPLGRGGGGALRREHDRRRRHPRLDVRRLLRAGGRDLRRARRARRQDSGLDVPVHVDGASGGMFAPFVDPDLVWDFRLPRVASINTSGHKYGLVYPGVGWIVWRDAAALPDELIFRVNYLGDTMPTFALNFSRPGAQVVAQYYNFLRLGFEGYRRVQQYARDVATGLAARLDELGPFELLTRGDELPVFAFALKPEMDNYSVFDVSLALRERGWQVPAYTFPENRTDLAALRVVVRRGFTHDMADLLVADVKRQLKRLEKQAAPTHDAASASGVRSLVSGSAAPPASTTDPQTATAPSPLELLRSRPYAVLLVVAAIIGVAGRGRRVLLPEAGRRGSRSTSTRRCPGELGFSRSRCGGRCHCSCSRG